MIRCPECRHPLVRSENIVKGVIILACRFCRIFQPDGATEWVPAGPGFRDELARIAGVVKIEKSINEQAMTSPITDPRWDAIERMVD